MRLSPSIPLLSFLLVLTGCSLTDTAPPSSSLPGHSSLKGISGVVHGGQQPIAGAQVYVFAAGTGGYGGNGIAASTANASTSLLFASSAAGYPTTQNLTGASATNPLYGDYYVTTDSFGNFGLTGEYTCTAGTQVYLYALGGDPSPGVPNSASGLLAALGQCPSSGSMASVTPTVVMNEVSTVAAAYAMAGFATDAVHVSSSGTTLAQTGIANAFANASNLENIATGTALATTPAGNGTVPQSTINMIADILANCVNSTGPTSTGCNTLFNNIKSSGSTGTAATDTATAAIYLARNPYPGQSQVIALYENIPSSPPFIPYYAVGSYYFSYTLSITFTGGGLNNPQGLAVDASGNAWVVNNTGNSVTKLSSAGVTTNYAGIGLSAAGNGVESIAIDQSGNAWVASNTGSNSALLKLSSAGSPTTYTGGGLDGPEDVAIDGSGNVWVANFGSTVNPAKYSVTEMSNSGTFLSGTSGYLGTNLDFAGKGIAIDGAGNAWISNNGTMSEFSSSGALLSGTGYTGGNQYQDAGVAINSSGDAWVVMYAAGGTATEFSGSGSVLFASGAEAGGMAAPVAVAVDGSGNVWIANSTGGAITGQGNGSITEFSSVGTAISPGTGYTGSGLNNPHAGIAVDNSGNVWIANNSINAVTEIIGAATPVITPICAGLPSTPTSNGTSNLGTRP